MPKIFTRKDADGATDFGPGLEALTQCLLEQGNSEESPIMLGSRAHLHTESMGRSFVRSLLTEAFHICVVLFVGTSHIRDTQCGFKLFQRDAAPPLVWHVALAMLGL